MRDVIIHVPGWLTNTNDGPSAALRSPSKLTIIYFITGNPGLIGYYKSFLKLLAEGAGRNSVVAGSSLGGFEISQTTTADHSLEDELLQPLLFTRKPVYDLQDQIGLTHERLRRLIHNLHDAYPKTRDLPVEVILLGHSVGAYIALEVVRLQHSAHVTNHHTSLPGFTITATMLLMPTIFDIAQSPSGRLATPMLSNVPFFPTLVQAGAGALAGTIPLSWLRGLVSRVTGMEQGSGGLEATVQFLRTAGAVKQALSLARCEMAEIGGMEWKKEVWGSSKEEFGDELPGTQNQGRGAEEGDNRHIDANEIALSGEIEVIQARQKVAWNAPKHYFLFAKQDHWVADATRDAIVEAMGSRAKIVVDEPEPGQTGLVHAWCLEQNELVAGIVNGWLEEILRQEPD